MTGGLLNYGSLIQLLVSMTLEVLNIYHITSMGMRYGYGYDCAICETDGVITTTKNTSIAIYQMSSQIFLRPLPGSRKLGMLMSTQ